MNPTSGILAILSLIGVALNVRLDRRCFYFWGAANAGWVLHFHLLGQYAETVLFAVFFATSALGLYEWRRRKIGKPDMSEAN